MKMASRLFLISFAMGCAAEGLPENDGRTEMAAHEPSPPQVVSYEVQVPDDGQKGVQANLIGAMTGAAIRIDSWSNTNGAVSFGVNWSSIHAGSHIFVSASEIDNAGNRFMGWAAYTVQNIVVKEGRVEFRMFIDWPSPIRVSTDILVIDP